MTVDIVDCWLEAETAFGFRTFYATHLSSAQTILVVPQISPLILNHIADCYTQPQDFVMRWHSVYDPTQYTGVSLPRQQLAWIAADLLPLLAPHPSLPLKGVHKPLPTTITDPPVRSHDRIKRSLNAALTALREGETQDDAWSKIGPVDAWVDRYLAPGQTHVARALHFFGSPLTPTGPDVTFLRQQFSPLHTTIHLPSLERERSAQFLRRFAEQALIKGYAVWIYHDALDPYLIDHLIVPKLSLGMTSARAPHLLTGGESAIWMGSRTALTSSRESWWKLFQNMYTHAWQLMAEMAPTISGQATNPNYLPLNILPDQNF